MLFPLINKPLSPYHDADVARIHPMQARSVLTGTCVFPGTVCIRRGYRPTPVEDPFRHKIKFLLPRRTTMCGRNRTSYEGTAVVARKVGVAFQIVER